MSLDWHKRYHGSSLEGYRPLTLEERGAYTTILDLIYLRRGPIPDDMPWLAGWLGKGVTAKKAKGLVMRLVRRRKLYVTVGGYMNSRCEQELRTSGELSEVRARSAKERWARVNENKDMADAHALHPSSKSKSPSKVVVGTESEGLSKVRDTDSQDRTAPALRVVKP